MSDDNPIYLGDGVYARFDNGYGIELLANDKNHPTDRIYPEVAVLVALVKFARIHHVLPAQTEDVS